MDMRQDNMKVTRVILNEDWEGIYVDGELKCQNHVLDTNEVLDAVLGDGTWEGRHIESDSLGQLPDNINNLYNDEEKPKSVILHCLDEKSDKIYEMSLRKDGASNWTVEFAYGPRGGNMKTGNKGFGDYAEMDNVYEKILEQKMRKGYLIIKE